MGYTGSWACVYSVYTLHPAFFHIQSVYKSIYSGFSTIYLINCWLLKMHVQLCMHDAGWSADVERWESDSENDDSESEDEDEGKELLKLMV